MNLVKYVTVCTAINEIQERGKEAGWWGFYLIFCFANWEGEAEDH